MLVESADTDACSLGSEVGEVVHVLAGGAYPEDVTLQVTGAYDTKHASIGVDPIALGEMVGDREGLERLSVPDLLEPVVLECPLPNEGAELVAATWRRSLCNCRHVIGQHQQPCGSGRKKSGTQSQDLALPHEITGWMTHHE